MSSKMAGVDVDTVTGVMANYVQDGLGKPNRGLVRAGARAHVGMCLRCPWTGHAFASRLPDLLQGQAPHDSTKWCTGLVMVALPMKVSHILPNVLKFTHSFHTCCLFSCPHSREEAGISLV